jgi:D-amino-acid dehydrogenase
MHRFSKIARAEHLIHRVGQLYVYSSDKAFAGDRPILEMRQRKGAKIEILSAGEIRETEPALAHIFRRGVLLPNHGHCANPAGLVAALAETFVRNGGQILRQRVLSMDVGVDRVDRSRGGRRCSTSRCPVLAAGVWSGRLAAMLGHNVPIESHRGYHVTLADPSMRPRRNVGWVEHKFLATPMDAGLRFAGTVEIAGLDAAPNYRRADALLARGRTMFAGLQHGIASRWMGHRPCLPDSVPVIGGSAQLRNVFFAFGHGHVGLICAPATGRLIAEMITGATPGIDPSPYRINRFR